MSENQEKTGEIMVLGHEAWPGVRPKFLVIFTLSCIYLGTILYVSFGKLPVGH